MSVVTSAAVFEGVTAAQWVSDQYSGSGKNDQVFVRSLMQSIDVVTSIQMVSDIIPSEVNTSVLSQRRLEASGNSGIEARRLSSLGCLVQFVVEVASDPDLPYLWNASAIFNHVTNQLVSSIESGLLATSVRTLAGILNSPEMLAASVNEVASVAAVAEYSSFSELIVHRYPTIEPTHSRAPTGRPTEMPVKSQSGVVKSGWGDPNPWLIVVIALEICISIALCICCMKAGNAPPPRDQDPLALNALARRQLLEGNIDPSALGLHAARLREQYVEAVRAIPITKYRPPSPSAAEKKHGGDENKDPSVGPEAAGSGESSGLPAKDGAVPSDIPVPLLSLPAAGESTPAKGNSGMAPGCFVEEACSICLCPFEVAEDGDENDDAMVKVLNCGHGFHPTCLDEWLLRRNVCPMCKRVAVTNLDPSRNNRANPLSPRVEVRPPSRFAALRAAGGRFGWRHPRREPHGGVELGDEELGRARNPPGAVEMRPLPASPNRRLFGNSDRVTPDQSPDGSPEATPRFDEERGVDPGVLEGGSRRTRNGLSAQSRGAQSGAAAESGSSEEELERPGHVGSMPAGAGNALDEFRRKVEADETSAGQTPPSEVRQTEAPREVRARVARELHEMGISRLVAREAAARFSSSNEAVEWCFAKIDADEYEEDEDELYQRVLAESVMASALADAATTTSPIVSTVTGSQKEDEAGVEESSSSSDDGSSLSAGELSDENDAQSLSAGEGTAARDEFSDNAGALGDVAVQAGSAAEANDAQDPSGEVPPAPRTATFSSTSQRPPRTENSAFSSLQEATL